MVPSHHSTLAYCSAIAAFSTVLVAAVTYYIQYHHSPQKKQAGCCSTNNSKSSCCSDKQTSSCCKGNDGEGEKERKVIPLRILYGTQTGMAKEFAISLQRDIFSLNIAGFHFETSVVDIKDYDQDNLELESIAIFILSTWTGGVPPESAKLFCSWLTDMALDFRVSRTWLKKMSHAVFGLGNAEYDEHYCLAAKKLDEDLLSVGSNSICPRGSGDDNVDQQKQFKIWSDKLLAALCELYSVSPSEKNKKWIPRKQFRRQNRAKKIEEEGGNDILPNEEDLLNDQMLVIGEEEESDEEDNSTKSNQDSGMVDLEDIGTSMKEAMESNASREMVTPLQKKTLTKEGYKLIGTHSAVKLCRWTKHQLRGRGGCYKHTFYGITSYLCMETTPSLACANKCVFCWRHHKNPVGREWRWKVDDPIDIVNGAIEKHQAMIKEVRGLPGLKLERWKEAFTPRHCALSLVGEPIMYPHINEFVQELHNRKISSFLVTNAQFPEKITELEPITQLYVSVDAGTKESLKAVDRPLFKDFWERFLACLVQLKLKGQRTVYRLTLVKSYNMKELDDYCKLIEIGQPDLIEIKAVTYCGVSDGSDLTMKDVPYHAEVREFATAICERLGGNYGLASEHSHSNCVLVAKTKFCVKGKWHTWIDYEKFHQLVAKYYEDGTTFRTEDYMAETPDWAQYNAPEKGFDPVETRFRRTKGGKVVEVEYKSTESGCG